VASVADFIVNEPDMLEAHVIWDLPNDPEGNVQHIAEHGITQEEVEEVLFDSESDTVLSKTSSNQVTFGYTSDGRYIAVVWEHVLDDPLTLRPITAYEAPEPR
jgi:uncharacterized DUF497 family protein